MKREKIFDINNDSTNENINNWSTFGEIWQNSANIWPDVDNI